MKTYLANRYFGGGFLEITQAMDAAYAPRSLASTARTQARCCGLFYTLREYLKIAALRNFSSHLAVSRALALPRVKSLSHYHPRAAFKYLRRYLARGLCMHSRAAILAHHYSYLNRYVGHDFMQRICEGQIALWSEIREGNRYEIALTYPRIGHHEGELALMFLENATPLFTVSFTLAPGKLFGVEAHRVLFVGRIQGRNGDFDAIKRATKCCEDISPLALLLAATQAIAQSFDIHTLVGVSAREQVSVGGNHPAREALSVYDGFWQSVGAEPLSGNLFLLHSAQEQKPLSLIKSNHRSRVKRKREFKSALAGAVHSAFQQRCLA